MGNCCGTSKRIELVDTKESVIYDHESLSQNYEPAPPGKQFVFTEKPIPEWCRIERIKRTRDGKLLVLKRVEKAKLPTNKYYVFPCSADSVCVCKRCVHRRKGTPHATIAKSSTVTTPEKHMPSWSAEHSSDTTRIGPPEADTKVSPLELVLLQTNNDADRLPEFVESLETERYYYYVTKSHGIKLQKVSRLTTWFRPKYHPVNWIDYIY